MRLLTAFNESNRCNRRTSTLNRRTCFQGWTLKLAPVAFFLFGGLARAAQPFEITGTVFDVETHQPIDQAYVLATYKGYPSKIRGSRPVCIKTLGMYTGPDGQYHFPVEGLDGLNPFSTNAIKPGYHLERVQLPNPESAEWIHQRPEVYANRNIYLKKQDPSKPDFGFSADGGENCDHAVNAEAFAPAATFIEIAISEKKRLGAPRSMIEGQEDLLRSLQGLPPNLERR